jgi:Plavaka transposase
LFLYSLPLTDEFTQDIIAEDPETDGSLFVPIILGSDKTTVSVGTGDNEYYPLYMSIGNIHNNVRRAHRNGVVLVGFLVIPKSQFILLHSTLY